METDEFKKLISELDTNNSIFQAPSDSKLANNEMDGEFDAVFEKRYEAEVAKIGKIVCNENGIIPFELFCAIIKLTLKFAYELYFKHMKDHKIKRRDFLLQAQELKYASVIREF